MFEKKKKKYQTPKLIKVENAVDKSTVQLMIIDRMKVILEKAKSRNVTRENSVVDLKIETNPLPNKSLSRNHSALTPPKSALKKTCKKDFGPNGLQKTVKKRKSVYFSEDSLSSKVPPINYEMEIDRSKPNIEKAKS